MATHISAIPAVNADSPQAEGSAFPTIAVVPVAGHGTRLRPLSAFIPKELLPIGRHLALWRIAGELAHAGIRRIVFVVSPEKQSFVERCFTGHEERSVLASLSIDYCVQPTMRGLGDAVLCAREAVADQPFLVALGDAVYEENEPGGLIRRLMGAYVAEQASVGLAVQRVPKNRLSRYGVVRPVRPLTVTDATIASVPAGAELAALASPPTLAGIAEIAGDPEESLPDVLTIDDIVEKPAPEDAPSDLAAAARYVLSPEVFAVLAETAPDGRGEVQLTTALRTLLRSGKKGVAVPLRNDEVRHDIGSPDSYFRAFVTFAARDPEQGPEFVAFLRRFAEERRFDREESENR
ncbi:MAG: sugar phosphate nucleotidyltransferase [Capsulimonadales bacterium]|nr:sugar phosphate nucleotidyltransferase [Capsulimonadales bacterium]